MVDGVGVAVHEIAIGMNATIRFLRDAYYDLCCRGLYLFITYLQQTDNWLDRATLGQNLVTVRQPSDLR